MEAGSVCMGGNENNLNSEEDSALCRAFAKTIQVQAAGNQRTVEQRKGTTRRVIWWKATGALHTLGSSH